MPIFTYNARDRAGRPQTGNQEASSAASLAESLRARGWLVIAVEVAAEKNSELAAILDPRLLLPIRSLDIELALQQVAVMLRSGLTLLNALKTAADNADRLRLRRILLRVAEQIQEGRSFTDSLAEHKVFSRLVIQLTRVGEATGHLDSVLMRAAEALERRRLLILQVLTAVSYPLVTLCAAIGVATFMVVSVIPKLTVFLKAMGRKLPPSTQSLVDISQWIQTHGIYAGSIIISTIVGLIIIYLTRPGRLLCDRLMLRLPLLGKVMRVAGTALFARAFGILIASGVTVLEGLQTVEGLGRNRHLNKIVAHARQNVFNGGSLAAPLSQRRGFMPMLAHMVAVGEASGTLENVLDEVARFHEAQLAALIRQLAALVEPVIIVLVGGIVGYVYISFFLAMYAVAGPK
ncbi:MAG TPA: type II secretion system F family protein [Pseudomonadales bacterium]|nr:type II secretion system F family protein [Pseudomonadales bacterium]